jgi:hypothetical protein
MLCRRAVIVSLPLALLRAYSLSVFWPSPFLFQKQSWKVLFLGKPAALQLT